MTQQAGFRALAGPVLGGAAIGVISILTAVLAAEPPDRDVQSLTKWGASLFFPERDIVIYLVGAALCLLLIAGLGLVRLRLAHRGGRDAADASAWTALYQVLIVGVAAGILLSRFLTVRTEVAAGAAVPASYWVTFGMGVAAILAASLWADKLPVPSAGSQAPDLPSPAYAGELQPRRASIVDGGVILLAGLVVYVYGWRDLAGEFLLQEGLFHWDYFALGPALAFSHGLALGTEVYSAYGVGWPVVFGLLDGELSVSPGRMIQLGSLYGCVYFAGYYLTLRLLVRRRAWAVFGTALALLTLFVGLGELVLWRFPSLTVMRWSMDVWCFVAVIMHLRTHRRLWAVLGGLACGLGVVFTTDTGLYLGGAFAFYWLTAFAIREDKKRHWGDLAAAGLASAATILVGLAVAGRADLLRPGFWLGWLETVLEFVGGIGMLPLATLPNTQTVVWFAVAVFVYLATTGYVLTRIGAKSVLPIDVFCGFVAIYGTLMLLHFVGRSGDGTPPRLILPLIILITVFGARLNERAIHADLRVLGSPRLAGVLLVLLIAGMALAPPEVFRQPISAYPNVFTALGEGNRGKDPCLLRDPRDVCGLPADLAGTVQEFHDLSDRLRQWKERGATFAVIDETGSLFYVEADSAPWGRYSVLFAGLHTNEQVDDLLDRLERQPPDYVLTRAEQGLEMQIYERWPVSVFGFGPRQDSIFSDSWERLRSAIRRDYRLQTTREPFEIWVSVGSDPAGPREAGGGSSGP